MSNGRPITALEEQRFCEQIDQRAELTDKPERQPAIVSRRVETDFAELDDGSLVEMIEDPDNSSRTLLAVYKDGEVRFTDQLQYGGRVLVPIPREKEILRHVRLPRGVQACESAFSLVQQIRSIFTQCLDLDEVRSFLLSTFVLSTWFIERLPVAPYVALIGLPQSGKSAVLKVLRLLCRRALLTGDITSAALYEICDRLTPTLLIDETSTIGQKRVLFHLLRTGNTRDLIAMRRGRSFKAFGAKVISWIELPNDSALNSRCIQIPLCETHRTDLKRPTDPEIVRAADDLQKQLLQFRFEKSRKLILPKIEGDERLRSRARDLYETLALPCCESKELCRILVEAFAEQQEWNREQLSVSQSAILKVLFKNAHRNLDNNRSAVGDLAAQVNDELQAQGEGFRLSARELGAALTSLGFTNRKRTNSGWVIRMFGRDYKRVHQLLLAYGGLPESQPERQCDFCREIQSRSQT